MSSRWELDDGIKSIKSAWQREHTARANLEKMLENAEDENAKLRELVDGWDFCNKTKGPTFDNCVGCPLFVQTPHSYRCARDERMRELGIEVNG